jgi:hypothetical protein
MPRFSGRGSPAGPPPPVAAPRCALRAPSRGDPPRTCCRIAAARERSSPRAPIPDVYPGQERVLERSPSVPLRPLAATPYVPLMPVAATPMARTAPEPRSTYAGGRRGKERVARSAKQRLAAGGPQGSPDPEILPSDPASQFLPPDPKFLLVIGAKNLLVPPRTRGDGRGTIGADRGVEDGVVLAGADHHRHRYGVAKHQRLLARV